MKMREMREMMILNHVEDTEDSLLQILPTLQMQTKIMSKKVIT